jgi:hypothetical protein
MVVVVRVVARARAAATAGKAVATVAMEEVRLGLVTSAAQVVSSA